MILSELTTRNRCLSSLRSTLETLLTRDRLGPNNLTGFLPESGSATHNAFRDLHFTVVCHLWVYDPSQQLFFKFCSSFPVPQALHDWLFCWFITFFTALRYLPASLHWIFALLFLLFFLQFVSLFLRLLVQSISSWLVRTSSNVRSWCSL